MPPTIGKIVKVKSNPRGFLVQPPGDPPPPTIAFVDVSADDLLVAAAAYGKGSDVSVAGTPPACAGVETTP